VAEPHSDQPTRPGVTAGGSSIQGRLRSILIGLAVALVSLVVGLIALEIAVRIVSPQQQFTCTVNVWDKAVGTRQLPGARGFVKVPEYAIDLIINSKGLRDREYAYEKPAGTRRILVLGDSFTCGYGVEADETYAKVLERLLAAGAPAGGSADGATTTAGEAGAAGGAWEVLNAGVGSTGTAHQLAYFETEGYKYSPDLVVLGFFQNDFTDNLASGLYTLEAGRLVKHEARTTIWKRIQGVVCHVPGYNTFFASSHLLNFVKVRVARRHYQNLGTRYDQQGPDSARQAQALALTQAVISALDDACAARGARLVVLLIPKIDYGEWPQRTLDLISHLEAGGIAYIDLAPAFRAADAAGAVVSYPADHHWNAAGHDLAARALYDVVTAGAAPGEAAGAASADQ